MAVRNREASSGEQRDVFVGRVLESRYRVESRLGEGGLGTVYRAQHLKLARAVAIKVLREDLRAVPQIRARFEREVRALSSMAHPNIVTITDYGASDGMPYLVMELVEGQELGRMIGTPMPAPRALAIMRQILASLAYAHERDVVHRDLKPANVIVRSLPDGRDHATVLDFGLAKFVGDEEPSVELTKSGLVVGTPAYMPPEQMAAGARKADARSDIYAAGLILFELLTGRRPFPFDDPADLLRAHLVMQPPTIAEAIPGAVVHGALEAMLTRALAKSPDDRYPNVKAMIDAIDALPAEEVIRTGKAMRVSGFDATKPARPTSASNDFQPRLPRRSRQNWLAPIVGIAACAISIPTLAWLLDTDEPETSPSIAAEVASQAHDPAAAPAPGPETTLPQAAEPAPSAPPEVAVAAPVIENPEGGELAGSEIDPAAAVQAAVEAIEAVIDSAESSAVFTEPSPGGEEGVDAPEVEAPFVAPVSAGPRQAARNPWRSRVPSLLARLHTRIEHDRDLSRSDMRALTRYRHDHPSDVRARLLIGHAYAQRGWFSAALDQYERISAMEGSARGDPWMLANMVRVARTESVAQRASDAITRIYGREALAAVQRAIERSRDTGDRARLQALATRLGA